MDPCETPVAIVRGSDKDPLTWLMQAIWVRFSRPERDQFKVIPESPF